jgi:hypothetical protein
MQQACGAGVEIANVSGTSVLSSNKIKTSLAM